MLRAQEQARSVGRGVLDYRYRALVRQDSERATIAWPTVPASGRVKQASAGTALRRLGWTRSIRAAKPLLHRQSVGALTGRAAFPSHGLRSRNRLKGAATSGSGAHPRAAGFRCRLIPVRTTDAAATLARRALADDCHVGAVGGRGLGRRDDRHCARSRGGSVLSARRRSARGVQRGRVSEHPPALQARGAAAWLAAPAGS
jgi:hypothetical protein